LYLRMILVHGENSNYDYMIKFKEIIDQLWAQKSVIILL
jgi:hypothetical protein